MPKTAPQGLKPVVFCQSFTERLKRLRKKADLAHRAKDPGLKPLEFVDFIQGAEAPCSLPKAKMGVFPQPVKPCPFKT
jgi:hypothetical protein